MAERAADRPKIRLRRQALEHLYGPERDRRVLYMVRRHCGIGVEEFRALRWEEQELIREGLAAEFDPNRWKEELARLGVGDEITSPGEVEFQGDNSLDTLANIMPGVGLTVREV